MVDFNSSQLIIEKARGHEARKQRILRFTNSTTKAALVMLLAAVVALLVANFGNYEAFVHFWHTDIVLGFGHNHVEMSLAHIINDIFMAIFFLLVGLEIKYEMSVGELTNIRKALLPILGACGGVLVPIVFYVGLNAQNPAALGGWGVPTATDIAFALGIMALLGPRVPNGVRVFLSTLAVADDIIAIIIIAVFYGQAPNPMWLLASACVLAVLIVLNRTHVYSLVPYLLVGAVLWACVFMSGIHATIAGVLLAFTIPTGSRINLERFSEWSSGELVEANRIYDANAPILGQSSYMKHVGSVSKMAGQVVPPAVRLEHALNPWVNFLVLPLFALTNADVALSGSLLQTVTDPVFSGVFLGLLLGKPIGITIFSFLAVKLKVASLPENVHWNHMIGAGVLGGVGFTMAIFVANLAFVDEAHIAIAKIGILSASCVAGIIGFSVLALQAKKTEPLQTAAPSPYEGVSTKLDPGEEELTSNV